MLKKSQASLKDENSMIVIKENVYDTDNDFGSYYFDAEDNSVIRSKEQFTRIFDEAGLKIKY